ncbi:MAG: GxxExxY protein [Verrucomicrobiota bacterium]
MSELIHAEECYQIVGACFEVYNEKGSGFLEPVYHDCLDLEFALQSLPRIHEPALQLTYKGRPIKHAYSPDFTCWEKVVVEIKAVEKLTDEHVAQVLNYLNATGYQLGVLINLGPHPGLEWKRIVRSKS